MKRLIADLLSIPVAAVLGGFAGNAIHATWGTWAFLLGLPIYVFIGVGAFQVFDATGRALDGAS